MIWCIFDNELNIRTVKKFTPTWSSKLCYLKIIEFMFYYQKRAFLAFVLRERTFFFWWWLVIRTDTVFAIKTVYHILYISFNV